MVEEHIRPLEPASAGGGALPRSRPGCRPTCRRGRTRGINTSIDSVHASGPLGRVHVVIHGNSNYKQTGLLQAFAAYSLLQQPPQRAGFASACQAFGHRELLGVLRNFGLVMEPDRHRAQLMIARSTTWTRGRRSAAPPPAGRPRPDAVLRRGPGPLATQSPPRWPGPASQPGDKVAILSGNDVTAFACVFGIARRGAVWCPINPRNSAEENRQLLDLFDCRCLFFHSPFAALVAEIAPKLPKLTTSSASTAVIAGYPSLARVADRCGRAGRGGPARRRPRAARRHRRDHGPAQGRDAHRPQHRDDVGADADGLPVRRPPRLPGARAAHPRRRGALLPDHGARRADRRHAGAGPGGVPAARRGRAGHAHVPAADPDLHAARPRALPATDLSSLQCFWYGAAPISRDPAGGGDRPHRRR